MWTYSSTYLDFVARYRYTVSFAFQLVYPKGKVPKTPPLRGWKGFIVGAELVTKKTTFFRVLMARDAVYVIRYDISDNCNWVDNRWQ